MSKEDDSTAICIENKGKTQEEMMEHLEVLKALRPKTLQLKNLESLILEKVNSFLEEKKNIEEYAKHHEMMTKERDMHMKAVESIDKDKKQLEDFIEIAQVEQEDMKKKANDLFEQYEMLKVEVNCCRRLFGLEHLPDLAEIGNIN